MFVRTALNTGFALLVGGGALAQQPEFVPVLKTDTNIAGDKIAYPNTEQPWIAVNIVTFAPGDETPVHTHPVPTVAYVLEGVLTLEIIGGLTQDFKAGDAFLESVDKPHKGTNKGDVPVKLLVTTLGVKDQIETVLVK